MEIVEEAIIFAAQAHYGKMRKMAGKPYILHPMEVATIISSITDDKETIAAGILHDTIEDCNVSPSDIESKFGPRVRDLVLSETEQKRKAQKPEDTWLLRKEESLLVLKESTDDAVSIMWLADKLSNIRSVYSMYRQIGDKVWDYFHQKDKKMHAWYYKTVAEYLKNVQNTEAFREYVTLISEVFGEEGSYL